jgi:hypothetical protein
MVYIQVYLKQKIIKKKFHYKMLSRKGNEEKGKSVGEKTAEADSY